MIFCILHEIHIYALLVRLSEFMFSFEALFLLLRRGLQPLSTARLIVNCGGANLTEA